MVTLTRNLDIWISGHLDIWVFGYLDIWMFGFSKSNLLLDPHSEILCGAALPVAFFSRKNTSVVICDLEQCFFPTWEKSSASDFNMVQKL